MEKREWKRILLVFGVILVLALIKDIINAKTEAGGTIYREQAGGYEREVDLVAKVEGLDTTYTYHLIVEPAEVTKQEAEEYFAQAKAQIEKDFEDISTGIPIEDYYASDMVEATWKFTPEGYVKSNGRIVFFNIPDDGVLVQTSVLLTCGSYEQIVTFPIWIDANHMSQEERYKEVLEHALDTVISQTQADEIVLPTSVNDRQVEWKQEKDILFFKILFLELLSIVLLFLLMKQKEKVKREQRKNEAELSYADVVNQLVILLRAGMTTRQAWNHIAARYTGKKRFESVLVSDAIYRLNMRMKEGEKERAAYELFAKEVDVTCYRRLMRILVANLEKGSADVCAYLEEEGRAAYEERILLAKRKGEEASTKMLIPLTIMLMLVMAIVLIPAMISFSM